MKHSILIAACLALGTTAYGSETNNPINTNYLADTNYFVTATTNMWATGKWTVSTTVTFGDGIVLDTETGNVTIPASYTNMTEVAKEFWRAVYKVAGKEPPAHIKKEEE